MRFLITLLFISLSFTVLAQSPGLINYQGVARDASSNPVINQAIALKFDILQGSSSGPVIYTENQNLSTNNLGLFTTQIGKNVSLSSFNWQAGPYYLQVSMDATGGTNYINLGAQQLVSVPMALHAQSVPSSYTNNVLSIGSETYGIYGTPVTVAQGSGTNISVSGGTNYTISYAPPLLALTPNNASISILGSNTVALPASVTPTLYPSGIATVTNGAFEYTVGVPVPSYDAINGVLSFGTNNTVVTPSLMLSNGVLYSGPTSNSVQIPSAVTVAGTGQATVTGGPNYLVNVASPSLALSSNNLSISIVGSNSVALPSGVTVAQAPNGIVSVTGGPPNYIVGVPDPIYNGTVLTLGASSTTLAPTLNFAAGVLTSGPASNSVILSGLGPWTQAGTSVSLTTATDNVAIGLNAATNTKLDVFTNAASGSAIRATSQGAANTSPAVDVSSAGTKGLAVTNTGAGMGGSFTSGTGYALYTENNSATTPAFYAYNSNASAASGAGYFKGGFITEGKSLASAFAFNARNSLAADLFVVRNDGFVGIGTNAPGALLDIDVQSQLNAGLYIRNARDQVGGSMPLTIEATTATQIYGSNTFGRILRMNNTTQGVFYDFGIDAIGSMFIGYNNNYSSPYFSVHQNGNVGIGRPTNALVAKLDVEGNLRLNSGQLYLGAVGGVNNGYTGLYANGSDLVLAVFKTGSTTGFGNNSLDALTVKANSGRVGINTAAPTSTFEVNGNVKITDGTQANGKVLMSDASGAASWKSSPAAISFGNLNGSSTNVNAGIPTPLGTGAMVFTKQYDNSEVEISLYSRAYCGTFPGGTDIYFEIYVDNSPSANSTKHYFFTSGQTDYINLRSYFSGLSAGSHTITIIAQTSGGTSSGVLLDPIGYGGKVQVKETF